MRALNVTLLFMAYQAELLEELGAQLGAGNPNPAVWEEICNITEHNIICKAPIDSSGLFGQAVAAMRQRCDLQKKEGEAFDICLPRKRASRPPVSPRPKSRSANPSNKKKRDT